MGTADAVDFASNEQTAVSAASTSGVSGIGTERDSADENTIASPGAFSTGEGVSDEDMKADNVLTCERAWAKILDLRYRLNQERDKRIALQKEAKDVKDRTAEREKVVDRLQEDVKKLRESLRAEREAKEKHAEEKATCQEKLQAELLKTEGLEEKMAQLEEEHAAAVQQGLKQAKEIAALQELKQRRRSRVSRSSMSSDQSSFIGMASKGDASEQPPTSPTAKTNESAMPAALETSATAPDSSAGAAKDAKAGRMEMLEERL